MSVQDAKIYLEKERQRIIAKQNGKVEEVKVEETILKTSKKTKNKLKNN